MTAMTVYVLSCERATEDAILISDCRQIVALERRFDELCDRNCCRLDFDPDDEREMEANSRICADLAIKAAGYRPASNAALQAMAQAALAGWERHADGRPIAHDLGELLGVAVLTAVAGTAA